MQQREAPIDTLRRFAYRTDELLSFPLVETGGLRASLNINAPRIGAPISMTHYEPNSDAFRSYLMAFRHFVMKGEPVFIGYVSGVAHRHITSDEFVALLAEARQQWKDAMRRGSVVYKVNDEQIAPEHLMDLWINGGYFHQDLAKERELHKLIQAPLSRYIFLNAVVSASKAILYTGYVVKLALREGMVSESVVR